MPVHVAVERLLAAVDIFTGRPRAQREQARVDLHGEVLARAEGAADAGERDPHLLLGQAEARRDLLPVDVQPLRRDVEVDAAVGGRDGEPGLRPERRLVLHRRLVVALDPDVGLDRVGVPADDVHVAEDVAEVVHARRSRGGAPAPCRRRRASGSYSTTTSAAAARACSRRLGGDERDRLADVADDVVREHGLVAELEPERLPAGDVGGGEDGGDAGAPRRGRDVDRADPRGRVRGCGRVTPQSIPSARRSLP